MITKETDYALRTALYLARQYEKADGVSSTAIMAVAMAIPYRFLRKIVGKLVAAGLLVSQRGKGGGVQ
jgi:DNA-binding IscR family transcriptional regulator